MGLVLGESKYTRTWFELQGSGGIGSKLRDLTLRYFRGCSFLVGGVIVLFQMNHI